MENFKVKFKKLLPTIIFNTIETIIIVLIGILLNIPIEYIILIIFSFMIPKGLVGQVLHFKSWYRCLIWSALVMLSLFVLFKVDLVISITFGIFTSLVLSGRFNINDTYLWKNKGEPDKNQDIIDFIKYNEFDTKLLEFEDKIKSRDNLGYLIYKYRLKEHRTFTEISELLDDMEPPRIYEKLDRIAFALRLYCGI